MAKMASAGPDALSELAHDHDHVRELVSRLEEATGAGDNASANELAHELTNELNAHTAIEEEVFYPAVLQLAPDLRPEVEEALEEHQKAKELLFEAASGAPAVAEEAAPETGLLTKAVEHHLAEEKLFESVRRTLGVDELHHLAGSLDAKKRTMGAASVAGRATKEHDDYDATTIRSVAGPPETVTVAGLRST
jgi:hypothetical protein